MDFYLLGSKNTLEPNRLIISSVKGDNVFDCVQASSWIEAKHKLGYPLTPLQSEILANHV